MQYNQGAYNYWLNGVQLPNQYYPQYQNPFTFPVWMPTNPFVYRYSYPDQNMRSFWTNSIDDFEINYPDNNNNDFYTRPYSLQRNPSIHNLQRDVNIQSDEEHIDFKEDKQSKKKSIAKRLLKSVAKTAFEVALSTVTQNMFSSC